MAEITQSLYRAGSGEPLVLLHGFTGHWRHWKPLLPALSERYEVIAPTLSGHDGGPAYDPDLPLSKLADAGDSLEEHLDDLGVQSAHFAGNSMGGSLAIEMAKRGRARSVVALSPGGGWEPEGSEPERIARFFARQMKMIAASRSVVGSLMSRPRARTLLLRDIMRHGHRVSRADATAMSLDPLGCSVVDDVLRSLRAHTAHLTDLDQVAAPTLLAWSEYDRILPMKTCSARLAEEIPGAEFRVLAGVGHVPMWDDTPAVLKTICDWVDAHASGQPDPLVSSADGHR